MLGTVGNSIAFFCRVVNSRTSRQDSIHARILEETATLRPREFDWHVFDVISAVNSAYTTAIESFNREEIPGMPMEIVFWVNRRESKLVLEMRSANSSTSFKLSLLYGEETRGEKAILSVIGDDYREIYDFSRNFGMSWPKPCGGARYTDSRVRQFS